MRRIRLMAALVAALAACAGTALADGAGEDEALAIAQRYGMNRFDELAELRFAFNVRRGTTTVRREWSWDIKGGTVSVTAVEADSAFAHTYRPADMSNGEPKLNEKADRWFVNDSYWLLFPYHFAHDRHVEMQVDELALLPIPPGQADRLTVAYGDGVGYTPGDVYEFFVDADRTILQMIFRRGGAAEPSLIATWEDHVRLGPITLSLRHRSADGSVEIWFTDVQARLDGSDGWIEPARER